MTTKTEGLPACPVAPDSYVQIPRLQTAPKRWQGEGWADFVTALKAEGVGIIDTPSRLNAVRRDAGGLVYGRPHGLLRATSAMQIAAALKAAQRFGVPVKTRGGGLTTEGETVAHGGLLIDMTGMSGILAIDREGLSVRTQAGIFWHSLAEGLRRHGLDYLSAPLNLTSSVGGTLGVGGIDINSAKFGCSADQALALQVVTPRGEIVECSPRSNAELFERVLLGYGQFGVITEATLRIRPYTPISMRYFYYGSLRTAIEDLMRLNRGQAADYSGILTMLDKGINLLVAFDSEAKEREFDEKWQGQVRGHGELGFALRMGLYYASHPWRLREALYLLGRKRALLPEFSPAWHMRGKKIDDRTVVFSRAVWKFWGSQQLMIPDLATNEAKFIEAVERGTAVCKKYFPAFTLYCVGIKIQKGLPRYEMSSIPDDAEGYAYGCEFEPMLKGSLYSRDYLQSFKNEIYDIGVDMQTTYYRFGGSMKGYIRRVFSAATVERQLALKREADPAMILNADVVF